MSINNDLKQLLDFCNRQIELGIYNLFGNDTKSLADAINLIIQDSEVELLNFTHIAIIIGNLDILKKLYSLGADISHSKFLNTAIYHQNIDIINFLIEKVHVIEENHMYEAIATNNLEIVKLILKYYYISTNAFDYNISFGTFEIFKYFIEYGYEIQYTSLQTAIYQNQHQIIEYIIENNLIKQTHLSLAINACILYGDIDSLKYLISKGITSEDLLSKAAANPDDNIDIFNYINSFYNKNQCEECLVSYETENKSFCDNCKFDKEKALIEACETGNLNIVKNLIDEGINPDCMHGGPLISAIMKYNKDIIKELLHRGADVNIDESNPIIVATIEGFDDIVHILLSYKAIPHGSALTQACRYGYFNICKLLVEAGADIMYSQNKAIFIACLGNHYNIVDYLLSKGSNLDIIPRISNEVLQAVLRYKKSKKPLQIFTGIINEEEDCAICLIDIQQKQVLTQCNTCKKITHFDCQRKWGRNCVYCRAEN